MKHPLFLCLCLVFIAAKTGLYCHSEEMSPNDDYHLHICAFHIAKDNPAVVIETQHYCSMLRDNLFQCTLFETTPAGTKPKLLGVEYVISDDLYQKLSPEEKKLWHPHNFEVRQGLLATIGTSDSDDRKTIEALVTTWGKTWHTWPDPTTDLPLGAPRLMWSATKEGDIPEAMIKSRDKRWNIDTEQLKKERAEYLSK
jgi:hypothetical protein